MKREIICKKCESKLRKLFPIESPYPGEYVKFVEGTAKKPFLCDHCGCKIIATDKCIALSMWADYGGVPYYKWESEYLFDLKENLTATQVMKKQESMQAIKKIDHQNNA